ncbi:hypothetical protein GCM10011325_47270 [Dyadobacter sediminis]|nr:hypothetical protein GCM10011325_47270 [Dyadobacter sediminis]
MADGTIVETSKYDKPELTYFESILYFLTLALCLVSNILAQNTYSMCEFRGTDHPAG